MGQTKPPSALRLNREVSQGLNVGMCYPLEVAPHARNHLAEHPPLKRRVKVREGSHRDSFFLAGTGSPRRGTLPCLHFQISLLLPGAVSQTLQQPDHAGIDRKSTRL